MKGIDIVYHADNNTMELKDAPDDLLIGTDGDDYATYLNFQIIDDEGILDGFSPYVLFEVESRPMIGLDESYTLNLTQDLLNKARYGKLPFMLVFKGKESTIEIHSTNSLTLGIAHSIDADREVEDDSYDSELAIKYVEITYHAESRLMELTDMPDDQFVGTDGDDYATYLRFTMDDPDGLLTGYGARVEFDVSIKDENGDTYKPFIVIDESMSVPLIQRILSNVKYGAIPIQMAFKGTDGEGRTSQFYSLNKLRLSISDSIRAIEGIDVNDRIDINSVINNVEYNPKTATFSFRQIDGGSIAVQLSDLSEEHFEVSTKDDLIILNKAQNGDTATTLDDGKWYKLYGVYSDPQSWIVMSPSVKTVDDHISDTDNPHNVTKSQIGLGNVDNTSDVDKPISSLTQEALDTKADAQELSELSKIVSDEIADRESSDSAINESISNHVSDTNNPHNVTKEQVGLGNVDNTSDADKPISTATQNALNLKADKTEISALYRPKGSVATYNDLPSSAQIGDVYDVQATGMNYVWTGSKWDELGAIIDLSPYYTKADVDSALSGKVSKSGDTMTGYLTISRRTPKLYLKNPNLDVFTTPSSSQFLDLEMVDQNDVRLGLVEGFVDTGGSRQIGLILNSGDDAVAYSRIMLIKGGNGVFATAPSWSVGTNDNSDKVLTIKMANSLPSLVHTTQNETISGVKKFTSIPIFPQQITLVSSQSDASVYPSTWRIQSQISIRDSTTESREIGLVRMDEDSTSKRLLLNNMAIVNGTTVNSTIMAIVKNTGVAYATAPTTPTDATSNEIATANWCHSNFVNMSGDVMSGTLTFYKPWIFQKSANAENIILKNTSITGEETGSRNTSIDHTDGNDVVRGQLLFITDKNHNSKALLVASNADGVGHNITIYVDNQGNGFALAPTPSDKADNSTKIATTGWVNQTDFLVHSYGNETISGDKTFTSKPIVRKAGYSSMDFFNTNVNPNTVGNWALMHEIGFYGTDGTNDLKLGGYYISTDGGGNPRTVIQTRRVVNGETKVGELEINVKSDGSAIAYAPQPPQSANYTEIVTANWCNSKFVQKSGDIMSGNLTVGGVLYLPSGLMIPASEDGKRIRLAFRGVGGSTGDRVMFLIDNNSSYQAIQINSSLTAPLVSLGCSNVPAYAPTPSNEAENSTMIATTGWVNTASVVVHTIRDEKVDGVKTFSSVPKINTWAQLLGVPSEAGWTKIATITKSGSALNRYCALIRVHAPYHRKNGLLNVWAFGSSVFNDCGADWVYNFGYTPNEVAVHLDTSGTVSVWIYQGTNRTQTIFKCVEQYGMWGLDITAWTILDADSREFATSLPTEGTIHYSTSPKVTTPSADATGTEIVNANWSLGKFVALSGDQTIAGEKSFTSTPNMPAIELRSNTPFIDFHYNNTAIDYTNRIISDADGQLKFINKTADGSKSFNVTISTVNQAMYLPVSTPSASTGNEVVTANWTLGKFVQKSGDTMSGALNVPTTSLTSVGQEVINANWYYKNNPMKVHNGDDTNGYMKIATLTISGNNRNQVDELDLVQFYNVNSDVKTSVLRIKTTTTSVGTNGLCNAKWLSLSENISSAIHVMVASSNPAKVEIWYGTGGAIGKYLYVYAKLRNSFDRFSENTRNRWDFTIEYANELPTDMTEVVIEYPTSITPSSKTDNSTKIVTTAWVNQTDFLVHTTGNETVAGIKLHTSPIVLNAWTGLHIKENAITKGSATQDRNINLFTGFYDKNDDGSNKTTNWLGGLRYTVPPNTTDASPNTFVELSNQYYRDTYLRLYDNGTTAYATCPTTPTNANSNEIATANWVNNKLASTPNSTTLNSFTELMSLAMSGSIKVGDVIMFSRMDFDGGIMLEEGNLTVYIVDTEYRSIHLRGMSYLSIADGENGERNWYPSISLTLWESNLCHIDYLKDNRLLSMEYMRYNVSVIDLRHISY